MTVKIQLVSSIILMSILFFLIPWLTAHFFKSDVSSILSVGILYFLGVNLIHISSTIFSIAQDTKL